MHRLFTAHCAIQIVQITTKNINRFNFLSYPPKIAENSTHDISACGTRNLIFFGYVKDLMVIFHVLKNHPIPSTRSGDIVCRSFNDFFGGNKFISGIFNVLFGTVRSVLVI